MIVVKEWFPGDKEQFNVENGRENEDVTLGLPKGSGPCECITRMLFTFKLALQIATMSLKPMETFFPFQDP